MRLFCIAYSFFASVLVVCFAPSVAADGLDFALIGDQQYDAAQEAAFLNLIADINKNNVIFTVHDGDFKSGASPCTDALFLARRGQFNMFTRPFVFLFGDNEWTDCHHSGGDPLERLAKLRELFTQGDQSLGQETMTLIRQSDNPAYSKFRENVMWTRLGVIFVGLHIVGSNNNAPMHRANGGVVGNQAEYDERNVATIAWMRQAFAYAKTNDGRGVMFIMQANPYENKLFDPADKDGFADFLVALRQETVVFGKPVVLVHGDSHSFRIDKPMRRDDGATVENFTRVETFGQPDAHWVRGTIDLKSSSLFHFRREIVEENLLPLP